MKILVGGFVAESNARVKKPCDLIDFMLKEGEEITSSLYVDDIFEKVLTIQYTQMFS